MQQIPKTQHILKLKKHKKPNMKHFLCIAFGILMFNNFHFKLNKNKSMKVSWNCNTLRGPSSINSLILVPYSTLTPLEFTKFWNWPKYSIHCIDECFLILKFFLFLFFSFKDILLCRIIIFPPSLRTIQVVWNL